jgi:hypothetical protein
MPKPIKVRPKLPPVSEQMKAWSAALLAEITTWSGVATRSFFGLHALYRRDRIFALLPRTRGMDTPDSIGFKIERPSPATLARLQADQHLEATELQNARWFLYTLRADADLRDAVDWLSRAYEAAGSAGVARKKPRK